MRLTLLILVVAAAACGGRRFVIDKASVSVPFLTITKVDVGRKSTPIYFEYAPPEGSPRRVGVHPPGHAGAFGIQSLDRSQTFALTGIQGIATLPDRKMVEGGGELRFALTFEPIPDDMWEFHVGEGTYDPDAGETSWQFLNVKLD